jgi:DNA-binding response OmpR family regulator
MSRKRALICEDDPAIRTLVQAVVKREGFDVDAARDGKSGLEKMESGCYNLVVLDLMMPDVDGYGVMEFMKNRQPESLTRVIVMSAARDPRLKDFPAPICTLLPKPFDIDQLVVAVRNCSKACEDD